MVIKSIIAISMKLIAPDPDMRVAMPYEYTAKPLLTPTEAKFHGCLLQITGERCRIQIKPRLADVFEHEKVNGAFQMISQKHVDFLVCRNDDWMPMLGIDHDKVEPRRHGHFGDARRFERDPQAIGRFFSGQLLTQQADRSGFHG